MSQSTIYRSYCFLVVIIICFPYSEQIFAQTSTSLDPAMTANGYTGIGMTPTADVMKTGTWQAAYSSKIPGATQPKGHNFLLGFGVRHDLEISLRLATQDFDCNFFKSECPPDTIRDLSGSFKWSPRLPDFLQRHQVRVAVGANDVGGAATLFRSTYAVASAPIGPIQMSAGTSKGHSAFSTLDGPFFSAALRPFQGLEIGAQRAGQIDTVAAQVQRQITASGTTIHAGLVRPVQPTTRHPGAQWQFALSVPMGVKNRVSDTAIDTSRQESTGIKPIQLHDLRSGLQNNGFINPKIKIEGEVIKVSVENVAYRWNTLDAAGVALGVLAGLQSQNRESRVHLIVQEAGMPILIIKATIECLKQWIGNDGNCKELQLQSALDFTGLKTEELSFNTDDVHTESMWGLERLRLDFVFSPVIASTIGTEVGSLDYHLGVSLNPKLHLWQGAVLDVSRLEATQYKSREFRAGGLFEEDTLKSTTNRVMFHQHWLVPEWKTALRATVGRGFTEWRGVHLETLTSLPLLNHWVHLSGGKFKGPQPFNKLFNLPIVDAPRHREYRMIQYGIQWGGRSTMTTEVTRGRYWRQDEGFDVLHRFWFGDTSIGVYYRKSKMSDASRPVAFGGLQLNFPLTGRKTSGWSRVGLRGAQDFGYRVESKVGEQDNIITTGYGEVPRFGESLNTLLNRSRWSQQYFDDNMWRLRQAHRELGN